MKFRRLFLALLFLFLFIIWTILLTFVNVRAIGPNGSSVGFSYINEFVSNIIGLNMKLYIITDWLGLVPIVFCFAFGVLGLVQWIKRKSFIKVDYSILILGAYYIIVILVYILFEYLVINYRPVLINNFLEASYPSSTTMLVLCVMPTSIMQLNERIKSRTLLRFVKVLIYSFIIFMVIGRLISGVHWLSDIIGGILISTSLVLLYYFFSKYKVLNK